MLFYRWVRRYKSHPAALIGLALLTSGLFKISAFAREAFIAARFGISTITDAYFGLQQFPLTLATFMFGSFALPFTPAYAEARRRSETVSWLPGLTLYGCALGVLLTVLMLASTQWLLRALNTAPSAGTQETLAILSLCYAPIVCIGIWSGMCTARGSNLWAMSMTGFPYLVMTLALLALYAAGALNNLGLPISMAIGFGLTGLYSFVRIVWSQPWTTTLRGLLSTWKLPDFRRFLRQLTASSIENLGYAANQLLILFFLARTGGGAVSANNCAMRVGMLGYTLLGIPFAQLVQARLCADRGENRSNVFRRWLTILASVILLLALILYLLRFQIVRLVYMHGKFRGAEVNEVASILPAWIGYFVVISLNSIVSRYLFTSGKGSIYVRRQLGAYAIANLIRLATVGAASAQWVIWPSVGAEFCAFVLNARACLSRDEKREPIPAVPSTNEAF